MPVSMCHACGCDYRWQWEEAFDKFGFGNGDGQVETDTVADMLIRHGYEVETSSWGCATP